LFDIVNERFRWFLRFEKVEAGGILVVASTPWSSLTAFRWWWLDCIFWSPCSDEVIIDLIALTSRFRWAFSYLSRLLILFFVKIFSLKCGCSILPVRRYLYKYIAGRVWGEREALHLPAWNSSAIIAPITRICRTQQPVGPFTPPAFLIDQVVLRRKLILNILFVSGISVIWKDDIRFRHLMRKHNRARPWLYK